MSCKVDYIPWLERERERLTFRNKKIKAERDTLIDDLPWYKAKVSRLEQRHSKLVSENTKLQNDLFSEQLIQDEADDKIKKLERENEEFKESHIKHITNMENYYKDRVQELKEENAQLKQDLLRTEELQDEIIQLEVNTELRMSNKDKHNLLSEISQHIGNKPSSSTYKYFRAKLNALEIKEGE